MRIFARLIRRSLLHIILSMAPHHRFGTLDVINADPSQCKDESSTNQHLDIYGVDVFVINFDFRWYDGCECE